MPVLPQALFPFVSGHFVAFSLFSARHTNIGLNEKLFYVVFNFVYEGFSRFKCRDIVCRDNDCCVF